MRSDVGRVLRVVEMLGREIVENLDQSRPAARTARAPRSTPESVPLSTRVFTRSRAVLERAP